MTRKEIQQLLESLNTELKAEIESSRGSLKEAKSITTQLNNLLTKVTGWLAKLEDPQTGVDVRLSESTAASLKISDAATQAETTLATVQQNLATVQQNIATMQAAYTEFEATKAKIDDPDTGLEAILESSQGLKDDLAAISKESETIYKEISRYKDSAAKHIASIEAIKDSSQQAFDNIQENETASESLKEKISKIFELVSQSGHANYFDKRRKTLVIASWLWLAFATICFLIAVKLGLDHIAPLVNTTVTKQGDPSQIAIEALIVRTALITPLLALGVFGIRNYGKERRLAEQYAFKAVSASTVEGSITLLERSLDKVPAELKHEKITDFAIETIRCIHLEPQELTKTSRFKFNAGNNIMKLGGELSDNIEQLNKNIQTITGDKPK
ncbi:MAG TPA: hypothetical protein VJM46_02190 [Candidatus Saccharimonadales bacterium]|nr:hypothetical protein [Candidatus Saccharimonadales bacterium]